MSKLLDNLTKRRESENSGGAPGGGSTKGLQNPHIAKKLEELQRAHTDREAEMDRLAAEQRKKKDEDGS